MNALALNSILNILNRGAPTMKISDASLTYIQHLFTPYAQRLESTKSIKEIRSMSKFAASVLTDMDIYDLSKVKESIISTHIWAVLMKAIELTRVFVDRTLLPWDIRDALVLDPEMQTLLQVDVSDHRLPVAINGKSLSDVSMEFVCGMLLASCVNNININITVFGGKILFSYMAKNTLNRFVTGRYYTNYQLKVLDTVYSHATPDFLEGFKTGKRYILKLLVTCLNNSNKKNSK